MGRPRMSRSRTSLPCSSRSPNSAGGMPGGRSAPENALAYLRVKFTVDDKLEAHSAQLAKYTDADMHNVLAYLQTLK